MNDNWHAIFALIPRGESGEVHSTLMSVGKVNEDAPPLMALTPIAQMLARFTLPPYGYVMKHDTFGDSAQGEAVKVAVLESPMLQALYESLSMWANSKWGYAPHISEQGGYKLPMPGTIIEFDRMALWYGEDRHAWRFGTGQPCAT